MAAVPAKRPGYSVRRTPSGNRIAEVRLTIYDVDYEASVAVVRNALGDADFQIAWTEGAVVEEAIVSTFRPTIPVL